MIWNSDNVLGWFERPWDYERSPRVMVVVAHSDDETLSAAGRIPFMDEPLIVHLTDSAPRNEKDALSLGFTSYRDYAAARQQELLCAMQLAGLSQDQMINLDLPDQEATLHLVWLANRLSRILHEHQPDVLLTHAYEGGHPDHDAAAFSAAAACRYTGAEGGRVPVVVEFAGYHRVGGRFNAGVFLPGVPQTEVRIAFDDALLARKKAMIACFRTQHHLLRQIAPDVERYRVAPSYDFQQTPHAGVLNYETWGMEISGARWRSLAAEALHLIGNEIGELLLKEATL